MRIIFNYAMSVIYILLGLFLIIWGWARFEQLQNKGLGLLLIAYGIFRAYRIYSSVVSVKEESEGNKNVNHKSLSE
jgi:hypothetical protein